MSWLTGALLATAGDGGELSLWRQEVEHHTSAAAGWKRMCMLRCTRLASAPLKLHNHTSQRSDRNCVSQWRLAMVMVCQKSTLIDFTRIHGTSGQPLHIMPDLHAQRARGPVHAHAGDMAKMCRTWHGRQTAQRWCQDRWKIHALSGTWRLARAGCVWRTTTTLCRAWHGTQLAEAYSPSAVIAPPGATGLDPD